MRPPQTVLGHPLIGGGAGAAGGIARGPRRRLLGTGGAGLLAVAAPSGSAAGRCRPTGGAGVSNARRPAATPAASMTNAAVSPAASSVDRRPRSRRSTTRVEPYVQYAFELAAYVVGWVPWVGFLAPQITFFYNLFEPMVQSGSVQHARLAERNDHLQSRAEQLLRGHHGVDQPVHPPRDPTGFAASCRRCRRCRRFRRPFP